MASQRNIHTITEVATFNDTNNHDLCSFTVPADGVVYVTAIALGKDATGNGIASKQESAATTDGVSITLVGSIVNMLSYIPVSNLGSSITIAVTGQMISVQVKGPTVAKSIEWCCTMRIYMH